MTSFTIDEIKQLLKQSCSASLASLQASSNVAYASLVNVVVDEKGPIVLISDLAWHTKNLRVQPNGSLLFVEQSASDNGSLVDPLEGKRATVLGKFIQTTEPAARDFYLDIHRNAQNFESFTDFSYWRLVPHTVHAIAGFGAITTINADEIFDLAN